MMVLDRLDSLWFFSNVLSVSNTEKRTQEASVTDPPLQLTSSPSNGTCEKRSQKVHHGDSPKPRQTQPTILLDSQVQLQPVGTPMRSVEDQMVEPDQGFIVTKYLKEFNVEQRRKRSRKFSKEMEKVKEIMAIGLQMNCLSWSSTSLDCGDLPPFSDPLAMKEHLKYWAHAVACNVK